MTDSSRVLCEIDDKGIATVTLNRPDKLNALDMAMFKAIDKTIKQLKKNKKVRVVILRGAGDDMCSGLDVKSVLADKTQGFTLLWKWHPWQPNLAQRVSSGWRELQVPVIAVLHGRCWGGGMQIALGADFRIADTTSSLSVMEGKWGLIPDMAGTLGMVSAMAYDHALYAAMTADTYDASSAKAIGLVTEEVENAHQRAKELADALVERSPDALAGAKRLYQRAFAKDWRALLLKETAYQWRILLGKNQRIAVKRAQGDNQREYTSPKSW